MIFDYLHNKGGTVYACYEVAMAKVITAIKDAIDRHMTNDKKEMSAAESVNGMKDDKRFEQDIFAKLTPLKLLQTTLN